jgi:hypothetical protein
MTDQKIREALRLLFGQPEPAPTISEYQREQDALHANHQRLKQQRREREAKPLTP